MRTITTAQAAVRTSGVQANHLRLKVKDADETWRDLTTYPGFNAVKQVSWKARVNDPHDTFDAVIAREAYQLSLSPFMEESALNKGFDPSAPFAPLIALNREVQVEVAVVPMDSQPQESDWMTVFHGRIDELDAARGKDIAISGRDLGGRLAQQYIKNELVYAFAEASGAMVSCRVWQPQRPMTIGQYLVPATRGPANGDTPADPGYNKILVCDTNGTTGTTEPVWTTGANQNDGTTRWDYVTTPTLTGYPVQEVIQKILNDNKLTGDAQVDLYTPIDPFWDVTEFIQNRGFTLEAVRALATQIGWDLRYKYREDDEEFQFTLYEPERETPSVLYTFDPGEYEEPTRLAISIAQIRNSVRVIYKDRADLWPDGTPKRKEVIASDTASIDEFGELWSELQEDENGNIDTQAEAERLATTFISDCAWPTAEVAVPLVRGFPWVELNDYYTFTADDVHSSEDLSLAVTGWTQDFQDGELTTKLELRGMPTIGHQVHIDKEHHPNKPPKADIHRFVHFAAPTTVNPNWIAVPDGVFVEFNFPENTKKEQLLAEYEIHVSDTDDFVPDVDTLVAVINGTSQTIPYQNPAGPTNEATPGGDEPYYGRAVPRWMNRGQLVRGEPSNAVAFFAGRGSTQLLTPDVRWGRHPLNGGFETKFEPAAVVPPDHWVMNDGVWDTDIWEVTGSQVRSGERCLALDPQSSNAEILSAPFQVDQARTYAVTWFAQNFAGGTGDMELFVKTYSDAGFTEVDEAQIDYIHTTSDPSFNPGGVGVPSAWQRRGGLMFVLNNGDKWARVGVRVGGFVGSPTSTEFRFDSIEIQAQDEAVHGEQTTSLSKSIASGTPADFGSEANLNSESMECGNLSIQLNDFQVWFTCTIFTDTAATGVEFFPRLTDLDGITYDWTPLRFFFNEANVHHQFSGCWTIPRPYRGSYNLAFNNIKMRWNRFTGTGTIFCDSNDSCSFMIK